ncbi:MAG: chemotaxis response regulator protein-glutamate methylesterase [Candidatus Didemnitutus sp.]|nr:chemotaxis response regulator protein-glutamate methylesterase [Candidatus Didemnitutus sp.]
MQPRRKIRVLIVDDSAVVRKLASEALSVDPDIEVVGTAVDAFMARDKLRELNPDVLTLDLEMPRMDGLTFLRLLMERRPIPVVVMSSLTARGSEHALEALRLGAVEVIGKPSGANSFGQLGSELIAKVRIAATARMPAPTVPGTPPTVAPRQATKPPFAAPSTNFHPRSLILLGASTGGTEALRAMLTQLPATLPPIAIVQHIPATFSKTFAARLDSLCQLHVREAVDGERLQPGLALIAPGNFHLLVQWRNDHYRVRVVTGPPVWHQRPAVDLLFRSASECGAAPYTTAGVLTGMGKDGAEGLLKLRDHGATTFAQDEESCVVYGMPRAAWENGGAQIQVPLPRIAPYLIARSEVHLSSNIESALRG